jgi:hypothetical protein
MERKFKGIWIPATLWESKELTLQEKCLIAEIDSFTVFFMSNKALADFMGVSKRRVQQIIVELSERGIVDVNTINDPDTGRTIKRVIQVTESFKRALFEISGNNEKQSCFTPHEENFTPHEENFTPGGEENFTPPMKKISPNITKIDNKVIDNKREGADKPAPPPTKTKRFVKPTLEDVRAYCLERQNNVDPESFVDFYESKGWKVGNQPMKDWKAAVRTWERRDNNRPRYKTSDERLREDDARRERMCKEYDEQHSQSSFEDIKRLLSK